jgi:hypothetical protein
MSFGSIHFNDFLVRLALLLVDRAGVTIKRSGTAGMLASAVTA